MGANVLSWRGVAAFLGILLLVVPAGAQVPPQPSPGTGRPTSGTLQTRQPPAGPQTETKAKVRKDTQPPPGVPGPQPRPGNLRPPQVQQKAPPQLQQPGSPPAVRQTAPPQRPGQPGTPQVKPRSPQPPSGPPGGVIPGRAGRPAGPPAVTSPPARPPGATARPPGAPLGGRPPASSSGGPGRGASPPLHYQQASPPGAPKTTPAPGSSAQGAPSGSPAGAAAGTPPSGFKPPASPSETYSRLKAAKEALEYYTSGNGRFVKDRDAQIEKLRREIGFLEGYERRSGGGSTPPATKKTPAAPTPPSGPAPGSSVRQVTPPPKSPPPPVAPPKGGVATAPGPGRLSPPTGKLNVYDQGGRKVGEKPYWGSGTAADPYRDYQDPGKPFGDRIWGSGTPSDPYTNVRPPAVLPEPKSPGGPRDGAGVRAGQHAGAGVSSPGKSSGASAPTRDRAAEKQRDQVVSRLLNLEKQFGQKIKDLEMAVDKWHDHHRAESERRLMHLQEGLNIIESKINRFENALREAEARGDREEVRRRDRDLERLYLMHTMLYSNRENIRDYLNNEATERARDKELVKNVHQSFQEENRRLLELSREDPAAASHILKTHHSSKWNPNQLDQLFQNPDLRDQSPLLTPTVYNPATEKSKAEKARWQEQRKRQIEREYEDRITRVMNEPVDPTSHGAGAALGKHQRIDQLRREKEARQRQIDIIYRERLLNSGRLSQEEFNALNTPEWEEKLEAYRRDLREGRVGGDWPTP